MNNSQVSRGKAPLGNGFLHSKDFKVRDKEYIMSKPSPPWLVPEYPPLKCDDPVGKSSVEGQIVYYPRVVRSQADDPINNQVIGNVSFMLFKEPKKFRNGQPAYGFFKLRGNWASEEQARDQASKIIREKDSRYIILQAPVGHWVPITDQTAFCKDVHDVKTSKDDMALHDTAKKEKMAEQKALMREIREREEELKQGGDIYDDPESLTYYSMRRVTEMRLTESRDKQRNQLEALEETLRKVRKELKTLEQTHSEYKDQWIERYNEERRKGGIPDFIPSEKLFDEYESLKLEDLSKDE